MFHKYLLHKKVIQYVSATVDWGIFYEFEVLIELEATWMPIGLADQ